jgi:CDP-diacylglycerol--serine O-phosphatidyltransferase
VRSFEGSINATSNPVLAAGHFEFAAKTIGIAVVLDGLDGRIARMTNTTSDFGRELDSLADVISFGIAPAVLAFAWGVQFVDLGGASGAWEQLQRAGKFAAFLFLICGTLRLARFNVQKHPRPRNPGRPDRKYFVGLPIPAGAAMVAAVIYAWGGYPLNYWPFSIVWMVLLALLAFLMISTWRYYSFKDLNLLRPRSPLTVLLFAVFIYLMWNYSQAVLLIFSGAYVASGIFIRVGGLLRRYSRRGPPRKLPASEPHAEHPVG